MNERCIQCNVFNNQRVLKRELANAGVFSVDVGELGAAYSVEIVVSAEVVFNAAKVGYPSIYGCIVGEYVCVFGIVFNRILAVSILVEVNVVLYAILEDVELVAAFSSLGIDSNCLSSILGGGEVSSANATVKVQSLVQGNLEQGSNVALGCRENNAGGNFNGKFLGCGLAVNGSGSGQLEGNGSSTGNNVDLVINDSEVSCVGRNPSDGNATMESACGGENQLCGFVDRLRNVELVKSFLCLFFIGLNDEFDVIECRIGNRNEIEVAVVNGNDTGYVGLPASLFSMGCNKCILFCGGECESRAGDTQVSFLAGKLEVEVAVIKRLTADLNALNGNERRLLGNKSSVLQVCGVLEDFGVISRSNGSLFLGEDRNGCFFDFVSATINVLLTGCGNGHTDFDAEVSRIIGHTVNIVSAAGCILQEYAVVAGAGFLRNDTGNNAFNSGNGCILFSCNVLIPSHQYIYGNGEVEGLGSGLVAALNGSGQNVLNFFCGLFVNVYKVVVFIEFFDFNLVGVNRPFNGVLNAGNVSYSGYLEVSGGNVLVLVEVVNVICCCIYVIHNLGLFFAKQIVEEITRCKGGYTESQGQQNY